MTTSPASETLPAKISEAAMEWMVCLPARYARWAPSAFDPQDGDRLMATSRVSYRLIRGATTTLSIVDAGGHVVRSVWTNRAQAAGTWGWTPANGWRAWPNSPGWSE